MSTPFIVEAALASSGNPFALNADGDATLRLQVPAQFAHVITAHYQQLFKTTFLIEFKGLTEPASDLPKS